MGYCQTVVISNNRSARLRKNLTLHNIPMGTKSDGKE